MNKIALLIIVFLIYANTFAQNSIIYRVDINDITLSNVEIRTLPIHAVPNHSPCVVMVDSKSMDKNIGAMSGLQRYLTKADLLQIVNNILRTNGYQEMDIKFTEPSVILGLFWGDSYLSCLSTLRRCGYNVIEDQDNSSISCTGDIVINDVNYNYLNLNFSPESRGLSSIQLVRYISNNSISEAFSEATHQFFEITRPFRKSWRYKEKDLPQTGNTILQCVLYEQDGIYQNMRIAASLQSAPEINGYTIFLAFYDKHELSIIPNEFVN